MVPRYLLHPKHLSRIVPGQSGSSQWGTPIGRWVHVQLHSARDGRREKPMEAVNHEDEGHRLYAMRVARVLAFYELEGDHPLVERLVYDQDERLLAVRRY